MSGWLSPPIVQAPSPLDRSRSVAVEISKEYFEKNAYLRKRTAVACFQGVERPYDGEDFGESILIYVLNIINSIEYDPDMVCVASSVAVPPNTPATVQVRPIDPLHLEQDGVCGVLTRIEFVPGEAAEGVLLPKGFADRYRKRLW
jgi:hypothetical protein